MKKTKRILAILMAVIVMIGFGVLTEPSHAQAASGAVTGPANGVNWCKAMGRHRNLSIPVKIGNKTVYVCQWCGKQ